MQEEFVVPEIRKSVRTERVSVQNEVQTDYAPIEIQKKNFVATNSDELIRLPKPEL
jgi:hypothetical protein